MFSSGQYFASHLFLFQHVGLCMHQGHNMASHYRRGNGPPLSQCECGVEAA